MSNIGNTSVSNSHNTTDKGHVVSGRENIVAESINIHLTKSSASPPPSEPGSGTPEFEKIYREWKSLKDSYNEQRPRKLEGFSDVSLRLLEFSVEGLKPTVQNLTLKNLFDPVLEGGCRPERVLVMGCPDKGTTLCWNILHEWANGIVSVDKLKDRPIVPLMFDLKGLQPKEKLEKVLFKKCHSLCNLQKKSKRGTKDAVRDMGENLVLILNGYKNEMEDKASKFLRKVNDQESAFFYASILITSETTENEDFLLKFDKVFDICEGSDDLNETGREKLPLVLPCLENFPVELVHIIRVLQIQGLPCLNTRGDIMNESLYHFVKSRNEESPDKVIRDVLHRLGYLFFLKRKTTASAKTLEKVFQIDLHLLSDTDILMKCRGGETYVPAHDLIVTCLAEKYQSEAQKALNGKLKIDHFFREFLGDPKVIFTETNVLYGDNNVQCMSITIRMQQYDKAKTMTFLALPDGVSVTREKIHSSTPSTRLIELSNLKANQSVLRNALTEKILHDKACAGWRICRNILSFAESREPEVCSAIRLNFNDTFDTRLCNKIVDLAKELDRNAKARNDVTVRFLGTDDVRYVFTLLMKKVCNASDDWEKFANTTFPIISELINTRIYAKIQKFEASLAGSSLNLLDKHEHVDMKWEQVQKIEIIWKYQSSPTTCCSVSRHLVNLCVSLIVVIAACLIIHVIGKFAK